jgi:hypothetical protein
MRERELVEKKEKVDRDYWFNRLWSMTKLKQMWPEKWLAKEEGGSSGNSSREEVSNVTLARGEDNLGSGDGNPWVTATRSQEIATHYRVTVTQTRVTSTRVRRTTGNERSRS